VKQRAQRHHDLSRVTPEKIVRRQVTELPEFNPAVIEARQHEVICPHCQCLNRGQLLQFLDA
jgi:hypothetical protein